MWQRAGVLPLGQQRPRPVDTRSPERMLVDAVLAAFRVDPRAPKVMGGATRKAPKRLPLLTPESDAPVGASKLPAEAELWIAVILDAIECAECIRDGRHLPATNGKRKFEYVAMDLDRQRRELMGWIHGDGVQSLSWIADELGLGDEVVSYVRRRIAACLVGEIGAGRRRAA